MKNFLWTGRIYREVSMSGKTLRKVSLSGKDSPSSLFLREILTGNFLWTGRAHREVSISRWYSSPIFYQRKNSPWSFYEREGHIVSITGGTHREISSEFDQFQVGTPLLKHLHIRMCIKLHHNRGFYNFTSAKGDKRWSYALMRKTLKHLEHLVHNFSRLDK